MQHRGKKRKRAYALPNILLALLLLVALTGAFCGYHYFLEKNVSQQLLQDVQRSNERNLQFFNNFVENIYAKLEVMALLCDAPTGSGEENWQTILAQQEQEGTRLGIANLNGVLNSGSHTRNISRQPYFSEALSGHNTVSAVITDSESGQRAVVFAVPILREGRVAGVLCNEYTVEYLGNQLNSGCVPGTGLSLIFAEDGSLVAGSTGGGSRDVFELLRAQVFQNVQETNAFRAQLEVQAAGYFEYKPGYFSRTNAHFLYYQPLEERGWTIVTSLEDGAYETTLQKISQASNLLSIATVVLVSGIVLLMIRMQRQRQRELAVEERDTLTGCYLREAALAHVEEYQRNHPNVSGACLFLDIDNFKRINDAHGHDKGDDALITVGCILREQTRQDDIVSRFGGDEFCVWVWDVPCRESAERLANRLLDRFRSTPNIRISMGVTLFPQPGDTLEQIMKRADQALYRAKRGGRNRYCYLEQAEEKQTAAL